MALGTYLGTVQTSKTTKEQLRVFHCLVSKTAELRSIQTMDKKRRTRRYNSTSVGPWYL
ncbi:unnamed protein product [Strongylus vulgaris]|uniref:Uncharacterized protein n=1 Tax=Strongylus vulgaris TaxID=40348 RepID=A0A3P7LAQ4_STRVU|nr:unnamed protein product [Strongylus vulgaris]